MIDDILPATYRGWRLDKAMAAHFPQYSRSRWQKLIADEVVLVEGLPAEVDDDCVGGERVFADVSPNNNDTWCADKPQNMPITVVFEDDTLMVVNKPIGLTVHPGAGQAEGTLVNALIFHRPALVALPRAGIVHRLDKDTSGLMVIAKTDMARRDLIESLTKREVSREYLALTKGLIAHENHSQTINAPIGRHPSQRIKMAVHPRGKEAITHIKVLRHFTPPDVIHPPTKSPKLGYSLVHCKLESGRTHQIRVHLTHLGFPLVGDTIYTGARPDPLNLDKIQPTQALHAFYLALTHPSTHAPCAWQINVPEHWHSWQRALKTWNEHFSFL